MQNWEEMSLVPARWGVCVKEVVNIRGNENESENQDNRGGDAKLNTVWNSQKETAVTG